MKPLVAAAVILVALAVGAQAQTPEIDALRARAEQGDAEAQLTLGFMYENGRGVPQDDAEAVRLYRLAAEQGHAPAQYNLGAMYAEGHGVPQDDVEAVRWWRLAAAQGNAGGQGFLGVMYATGGGVPQDDAAAQPRDLSAGGWERDLRLRPAGVTPRSESRLSPILVWRRG